jgi:hypothetical protein
MALKFVLEFENVERVKCVVNFFFTDYDGNPITLYGGARPFVLGEFNSDEDLFKPIRPQQATIEILASASGVKLEDFLSEDEDNIQVRFDFGDFNQYWLGFLSQEDMSEVWIATNHILTLRADDGIGRLKNIELGDNDGKALLGAYDFVELLQYATRGSALNFANGAIISNLFHTSMTDGTDRTGLDQCTTDARTFENAISDFDNKYAAIEKINRAWNQTMFQWFSQFYVLRIPEMFTTEPLEGFTFDEIGRYTISQRYDMLVGVGERVKPIMPEMLKTFFKPSKQTTIKYDWENFVQIVCNESFESGELVTAMGDVPNGQDVYNVDNWEYVQWTQLNNTTPSIYGQFNRFVIYEGYQPVDEYVRVIRSPVNNSARSCNVYVDLEDLLTISFQYSLKDIIPAQSTDFIALVQLFAEDGTYYTLDDDGTWAQSNSAWSTNVKQLQATFPAGVNDDWFDFEIQTTLIKTGYIVIYLNKDPTSAPSLYNYYRGFNVDIENKLQKLRRKKITGDFDRYTIESRIEKNFDETIFFDDAESKNYKGAIYETDGITLTGDEWYRMKNFDGADATSERFTFKRQNALARWFQNRSYKMKLDVNMYGLLWENPNDPPNTLPIGLINTIKFVDDAPGKIFAITNMKEIDFMNNTWSASLIEIFDESGNVNEPTDNDVHTFDYYYE